MLYIINEAGAALDKAPEGLGVDLSAMKPRPLFRR